MIVTSEIDINDIALGNLEGDLEINPYRYTGVNLAQVHDWEPETPFLNLFKSARPWITQRSGVWDTYEGKKLNLDPNGYLKSLDTKDGTSKKYDYVGTLINKGLDYYPSGKYVVLYDGQGTLEYGSDAVKDKTLSTPGRDILNVKASGSGIYIKLTSTDPNRTGNYLKNIRVVPLEYEKTFASDTFNPVLLNRFNTFKTLRFIDWQRTNHSTQIDWEDRPKPTDAFYSTEKGVPVEVMVALANKTNTDPWFNMPHQATDAYVANFAAYVRDHLKPNLKVYVEYSNEGWNTIFSQNQYFVAQGKKAFPQLNPIHAGWDWFSRRTTEVTRIWDRVWGGSKDRIIGVMAGQASNHGVLQRELQYAWSKTPVTHEEMGIDAIAIAPYFGPYLGTPEFESQVNAWTKEPDGGLKKLFDELIFGGVLKGGPVGGGMKQASGYITKHVEMANNNGLQLLAYESGQHLVAVGSVLQNKAIVDLFIKANRDPRMETLYRSYLVDWYNQGGHMMSHFSTASKYGQWGSWGLLENLYQAGAPKYNALVDLIKDYS